METSRAINVRVYLQYNYSYDVLIQIAFHIFSCAYDAFLKIIHFLQYPLVTIFLPYGRMGTYIIYSDSRVQCFLFSIYYFIKTSFLSPLKLVHSNTHSMLNKLFCKNNNQTPRTSKKSNQASHIFLGIK